MYILNEMYDINLHRNVFIFSIRITCSLDNCLYTELRYQPYKHTVSVRVNAARYLIEETFKIRLRLRRQNELKFPIVPIKIITKSIMLIMFNMVSSLSYIVISNDVSFNCILFCFNLCCCC